MNGENFDPKIVNEAKYLLPDLIAGDEDVTSNPLFQDLSYAEIKSALKLILDNPMLSESKKVNMMENLWRINYEVYPPTMEEFLTPKYIGAVADKLYDHVRQVLISFMNPYANKRVLALSVSIGFGKSTLSALILMYILVNLQFMRNPKKYFSLNQIGSIVTALLSFTQLKAKQLLLQPIMQALQASPIFHKTRTEDSLKNKQKELPQGHIAYTTSGRLGAVQLSKDLHVTVISDRMDLLGLNIIAGICSEISFFLSKGIAIEEIFQTYTDLRTRINNRFANAYLTATILDSSPLDLELSPIDKYIYTGEAEKDPEVMVVKGIKHWDVYPEKYPIFFKTGNTFPVFRGDTSNPPKVLAPSQIEEYSPDEIFQIPIDIELTFPQNLKKNIADLCAWPSGGLSKLFESIKDIENIFVSFLRNQYTPIIIPEEKAPEKLIWNQIKDTFFLEVQTGVYEFYRNPQELRAIHIDLSETGNISGISMSHLELLKTGEKLIVHDFNIPLHKGESRINIDAVCEFVIDLRDIGHLNIMKVTADQYQSATILQRLRRAGFNAEKLSVDIDTAPYLLYIAKIKSGLVKSGRSIHLKNNLLSLIETVHEKSGRKKIDHKPGNEIYYDGQPWELSMVGQFAKDISDTACGSSYTLLIEYKDIPRYIYDETEELRGLNSTEKLLRELYKTFKFQPKEQIINN